MGSVRVRARKRRLKRRVVPLRGRELAALRAELVRQAGRGGPARWNARPEDAQRALARLVLALAEFLRRLLERQAIRRMEAGTLTAEQTESIGRALMRLEVTIADLAKRFKIPPGELNLDLGPLGRLM
jgi:gas vesicle protein GvpK